jgi:hypothetical protein
MPVTRQLLAQRSKKENTAQPCIFAHFKVAESEWTSSLGIEKKKLGGFEGDVKHI